MQQQSNIIIDERVILERVRSGDLAAMEYLILKYQDKIYNTVLRMCANEADAAELTQDAFVKAIEHIHNFEGKSSFYTWVFRIAVNGTLNFCKRRFRVRFESLDAETLAGAEGVKGRLKTLLADGKSSEPAELAQEKELYELALKSLTKLDPNQRAVVVLRDIEEMD